MTARAPTPAPRATRPDLTPTEDTKTLAFRMASDLEDGINAARLIAAGALQVNAADAHAAVTALMWTLEQLSPAGNALCEFVLHHWPSPSLGMGQGDADG